MREKTHVLYNEQCPVCRYEIHHYRDYAAKSDLPIRFEDLNTTDMAAWGIDRDAAARRLYLLKGDKTLSGIPAFVALWQEMPRYRWLARFVGLPGVRQLASALYDYALAPVIYRWHLRRLNRNTDQAT